MDLTYALQRLDGIRDIQEQHTLALREIIRCQQVVLTALSPTSIPRKTSGGYWLKIAKEGKPILQWGTALAMIVYMCLGGSIGDISAILRAVSG